MLERHASFGKYVVFSYVFIFIKTFVLGRYVNFDEPLTLSNPISKTFNLYSKP
jgi:hypothetical protein